MPGMRQRSGSRIQPRATAGRAARRPSPEKRGSAPDEQTTAIATETKLPQEAETGRYCPNPECPAQLRERLIWFAARGQMDIDGLGEKMIHALVDAGLLTAIGDIYRLKDHTKEMLEMEGMGNKRVQNLIDAIDQSKQRGLAHVLAGLSVRHIGGHAANLLAQQFGDIDCTLRCFGR